MQRFLIAKLIIGLIFLTGMNSLKAQSIVEGSVVDEQTGEPLHGAHVFLSGTRLGTATNPAGRFQIQNIPPGSYRLVVSMIGFDRSYQQVSLSRGEIAQINAELEPVTYNLGEIYAGDLDERWEKDLDRFTQLFIGESQVADSVEILNPEVLRFRTRWWGKFTAEALAPLQIVNYSLGYEVTFYLDEFIHTGTRTRWDGEPFYTEMIPSNPRQAEFWSQNREKSFNGSIRHFLISVIENRIEEDGFTMYLQRGDIQGFSPRNRFRISPARILKKTDEDHIYHIQYSGRLEIIYDEEEDPRYVQSDPQIRRRPASVQTSYIELNTRPITVDNDGEIEEPYGATRMGYFAFHRIADRTPRDYRPEGFQEMVNPEGS
ncbi:MAG: carboxypeptidase-like regulatory domain-containing protein [Balneolaceae bacterium]